jgi:hypothetical protein
MQTPAWGEIESQIQQAGREAMKEGLKQAIRQSEEQEKICPHCGSERVPAARNEAQSPGFPVSDAWKCYLDDYGGSLVVSCFARKTRCLAAVKGQNVTADLRELAALVGSSWPSETAAGVLKRLSGVHLSDERVRRASQ